MAQVPWPTPHDRAAFAAIGQMIVVTMGPGNVALSIPAVMTLATTISLKFMNTYATLILPGIAIAPIIATLSSSFLFRSLAIWSNRGLRIKPPTALAEFSTGGFLGVLYVVIVGISIARLAWLVLERAVAGRWICAIGQNSRAARLSGVPINLVRFGVYVSSAILAAIAGLLLACFSGVPI
jgi:ribose transport system permease protein